mgnify:FL=1
MVSFNFKKLSFKQAYLSLEKKDVDEVCDRNNTLISKYIQDNYPEKYKSWIDGGEQFTKEVIKEPSDKDIERHEAQENLPKNKDLKKLYRKIAEKTHPDKVGSNQYSEIFSDAVSAYQENNLGVLIEIAGRLNIEVTELSPESIVLLEENIKFLANDIFMKKKSAAWLWEEANSDEEKIRLVEGIFNTRGISIYG